MSVLLSELCNIYFHLHGNSRGKSKFLFIIAHEIAGGWGERGFVGQNALVDAIVTWLVLQLSQFVIPFNHVETQSPQLSSVLYRAT